MALLVVVGLMILAGVTLTIKTLVAAVGRWQRVVHDHGGYDLEVDTSVMALAECAQIIAARLADGPPGAAFARLAHG